MPAQTRFRFTKTSLEKLQPSEKQQAYHDTTVQGLILLVYPTGGKTFFLYRRIAGRPERLRLGTFPQMTIEQAQKAATHANAAISDNRNPAAVKRALKAEPTFEEVVREFVRDKRSRSGKPLSSRTIEDYEALLRNHLGRIAKAKLSEVTPDRLRNIKIASSAQNNRCRALISSVFNWLKAEGRTDLPNPASAIKSRYIKSRERFLLPDEFPRFMAAVEANRLRDFWLLALMTGARKSNLREMRWQDVDLVHGTWSIPRTKNGESLVLPLIPEAVAVLKARKEQRVLNAIWVFPGTGKNGHLLDPRKAWLELFDWDELEQLKAGIQEAGQILPDDPQKIREIAVNLGISATRIDHLRIHDLRRTLGSWQARAGASLTVIGKSLGHKSQQATAIYSRLDLDPVRQSVESAATAMFDAAKSARGR